MPAKKLSVFLFVILLLFIGQTALAASKTYTSTADFKTGTLVDVNANGDQLQLDGTSTPFAFVNVAASARGTLVRIDAETGEILGEYRTAPGFTIGQSTPYPSRTAVDSQGNVWVANSNVAGQLGGSVVKIGIIIGGTRVKETTDPNTDDKKLVPDPSGEYLEGPFDYNTCLDRDGDGLIRTSRGLGDVLFWPDNTDGAGGDSGIVEDAEDECILVYQRLSEAPNAHHVSVDADDNVWVGGYPARPAMFYKLDGKTGAVLDSFNAAEIGCGGFGGLVDGNGVIWSADFDASDASFFKGSDKSALLYYDPGKKQGGCIGVSHSYGLAVDGKGVIWNSMWAESQIAKIDPSTHNIAATFAISPGERSSEGVAVTPIDNNVWVARGVGHEVSRLGGDGNQVSVIDLNEFASDIFGLDPTGVAVDANGKVWVTNLSSDNVMRINPAAADGSGAVDLVVALGTGAAPDNYSNMTGVVDIVSTPDQGTWTVVHDGGAASTVWDTITWNTEEQGDEPEGTAITVEARAANTEAGLEGQQYQVVFNGETLLSLTGQLIQIRVTLTPNDQGDSPVLTDLTVTSVEPQALVCDLNEDEIIDIYDILGIFFTIGDSAEQPFDPRDWNKNGIIEWKDTQGCIYKCSYRYCMPADDCSE